MILVLAWWVMGAYGGVLTLAAGGSARTGRSCQGATGTRNIMHSRASQLLRLAIRLWHRYQAHQGRSRPDVLVMESTQDPDNCLTVCHSSDGWSKVGSLCLFPHFSTSRLPSLTLPTSVPTRPTPSTDTCRACLHQHKHPPQLLDVDMQTQHVP